MNAASSPPAIPWPHALAACLCFAVAGFATLHRPAPAGVSLVEQGEMAIAFYKLGQPSVAQARMAVLLANPSPPPRLLYAGGLMALDNQQPREAIALLEQAASGLPDDADVQVTLGAALQVERRFDEAQAIYDRLLAKDPKNPRVLYNAALVALQLNRPKEGRDFLMRYKVAYPNDINMRYVDQKLAQLNAILERGMTAPPPAPGGRR